MTKLLRLIDCKQDQDSRDHVASSTVKRLRDSILAQLHISPDGQQLPFILGVHKARDNARAIEGWLNQQYDISSTLNGEYENLLTRLRYELESKVQYADA